MCGSLTNFTEGLNNVKAVTWITLQVRLEEWMMLGQLGAAVELESWTQILKEVANKTGAEQPSWQSREMFNLP